MKIFKNSVVTILVLFAASHLALTFCYSLPENLVPAYLKRKSIAYCEPVFAQGWSLFAPAPEVKKKIYMSYQKEDGRWSGWEAPFDNYLFSYQSNRMSPEGKIVLSLNTYLHYLFESYKPKFAIRNNCEGDISSGLCTVLKFEALRELASRNIAVKEIRLLVVYHEAKCDFHKTYSVYFPESAAKK
ncbi:MAG: hypothetical protein ACXVPN_14265 [Bacteroidia bacterium]